MVNSPYLYFIFIIILLCGPGSSVGIVTDYGLDGPELNPGGDEIFCPPSLPYGGYRVFPGCKVRPGRAAECSTLL